MKSFRTSKGIFSSFIVLMLCACASQPKAGLSGPLPERYIDTPNNGLIYDASFTYKEFGASGLLVLKKIENSSYHVALLSKFGPTLMEFRLNDEGITWVKTFDRLDRKSIENFIRRDFEMILLGFLEDPKQIKPLAVNDSITTYKVKNRTKAKIRVDNNSGNVLYAENKGGLNLFKTKAWFTYQEQGFPENIVVKHNNINLILEMDLLKVNHVER